MGEARGLGGALVPRNQDGKEFPSSTPGTEPTRYTNAYFCAFKRQVQDAES